jgi:hypothetical protein
LNGSLSLGLFLDGVALRVFIPWIFDTSILLLLVVAGLGFDNLKLFNVFPDFSLGIWHLVLIPCTSKTGGDTSKFIKFWISTSCMFVPTIKFRHLSHNGMSGASPMAFQGYISRWHIN